MVYFLLTCQRRFIVCLRSSPSEVLLGKGILKICSKFKGERPCQSAISIELVCNFTKIALWHGCSPVNLLHIFRTPFPKNNFGGLLLLSHDLLIPILNAYRSILAALRLIQNYFSNRKQRTKHIFRFQPLRRYLFGVKHLKL